ncbi:MAG: hypothetical protein JWN30_68 [Bacilli bacterium]|nr:hypothetical protein [Bacilli bacterium]
MGRDAGLSRFVRKIKIIEHQSGEKRIWISGLLAKQLNVLPGSSLTVGIGHVRQRASISIHRRAEDEVYLSSPLSTLCGGAVRTLHIKMTENELHLGPWIAVYAFETKQNPPFGSLNTLLKDTFAAADKQGLAMYILCPGSIAGSTEESGLIGYQYRQGKWVKNVFPWPDFLLSKIIVVPPSKRKLVDEEQQRLFNRGCHCLSRPLGSKWSMYQAMSRHAQLKIHLPATRLFLDADQVSQFLSGGKGAYIKAVRGTQGRNIYKIAQDSLGNWVLVYLQDGKKKTVKLPPRTQPTWIKQQNRRAGGYLIQREIKLLQDEQGRICDFRWLLQKDGTGLWQVTARIARIGAVGAITTNLSTGGRVCQARAHLNALLEPLTVDPLLRSIDQVAFRCAQQMEEAFGLIGEIGLDIGVDQDLRIWILEANPRPGRKMLKIVSTAERLLSLERPLEYARYATGFSLYSP